MCGALYFSRSWSKSAPWIGPMTARRSIQIRRIHSKEARRLALVFPMSFPRMSSAYSVILLLTLSTCVEHVWSRDKWAPSFPSNPNLPKASRSRFSPFHSKAERLLHEALRLVLRRILIRETIHRRRRQRYRLIPEANKYPVLISTAEEEEKIWSRKAMLGEMRHETHPDQIQGSNQPTESGVDSIWSPIVKIKSELYRRLGVRGTDSIIDTRSGTALNVPGSEDHLATIGGTSSRIGSWSDWRSHNPEPDPGSRQTPRRSNSSHVSFPSQIGWRKRRAHPRGFRPSPLQPGPRSLKDHGPAMRAKELGHFQRTQRGRGDGNFYRPAEPKRDPMLRMRSSPSQARHNQPIDVKEIHQLIRSIEAQSRSSHLEAIKELEENEEKGLKMQKYVNSKGTWVAFADQQASSTSDGTNGQVLGDDEDLGHERDASETFANAISPNVPVMELGTEYT